MHTADAHKRQSGRRQDYWQYCLYANGQAYPRIGWLARGNTCACAFLLFSTELTGIAKAADRTLDALKSFRAIGKQARQEVGNLFNFNKKKKKAERSKPAWRHKFVCLAFHDQEKIPSTDADKEELYLAGLGEQ